jgi:hypothetical protein
MITEGEISVTFQFRRIVFAPVGKLPQQLILWGAEKF